MIQRQKNSTKCGKFILGVHRKSANFAVLSELGRYPFYLDIIKSNRKAMNRNWSNQKANHALKTKSGNK